MSVRSHGRADVAALDIEQGQRAGLAQAGKRALEHGDPRRTEALEERRLWLDDRHRPGERLDAGHGKRLQALDGLTQAPVRQQCRVGVDAGTERAELVHGDPKPGPEGGSHRLCSHRVWAIPTASLNRANPLSCRAAASSRLTRIGAVGSLKVAVPTWIALAPAATSCSASSPVRTPPTPMIGTAGRRPSIMAARTCQMARTATGRMAGPDSPPVTPATWGSNRSVSMTIASRVLIMVSPSAPALTQARAISTMSVTSGLSLAKMGMLFGSVSRTRAMTWADERGSHAKTSPRLATLGQEMLTSTPTTASKAGDSHSAEATSAYSPAVFPAMETSTRAPTDLSHTRSPEANSAIPGPCKPIELSIPLGVSAIRGVPRPDRGSAITVLVTNAPSPAMSKKRCSSLPLAAQPEAVISGFGRLIPARSTRMSVAASGSVVPVSIVEVPVVSRSVVSLLVTSVLPRSSVPAHRRSADGIPGDPAAAVLEGLPADPVATEDRALNTGTSHSGQTVVAGHRHDAGHTDPDAAGHGLLDRDLGNRPLSRGEIGDRPEHRHRPASVDSGGATAADDVGQHVGDPAPDAHRAVVSGHRDRVCGTARLHDPEKLVSGGRTQHHLHVAAKLAQCRCQPEERSAAVASTHQNSCHRIRRQREAAAERADDVDRIVRLQVGQPPGARSARRHHDLDGAANGATGAHAVDQGDLVNRETPAQQGGGRLTADRHRDELAGSGELGNARCRERQVVVGADPSGGEQLTGDLRCAFLWCGFRRGRRWRALPGNPAHAGPSRGAVTSVVAGSWAV